VFDGHPLVVDCRKKHLLWLAKSAKLYYVGGWMNSFIVS